MGPLAVKDLPVELTELDPALITELSEIVAEKEKVSEERSMEVAPWFYFVPCAGVRYYSYKEWPSPVKV